MNQPSRLRVENLNVFYGQNQVLKNISLALPDNRITVIIGPSGCGKTTLLKSLNRLLDEQEGVRVEGRVLLDGQDIYQPGADITLIRKRMGLLSQKPQVLPMSIYDNVAFGPRLLGLRDRRVLDGLVEKYLRLAGLWDEVKNRLQEPAARLSIGQQQRLCLARGLAVEPEVILGDEPTSALDPQSSRNVETQLLSLKENYTIVLVTHILRQAKRLADYVAFLYFGELIEFGPASEVLVSPRDSRTRAYITGEIS
ncbi:MAG: phosphate ABC transporter ATP-binding protein [Candidatus Aminicenantes bacterium]|uniref:Phosphate transport ATP-binding protein PstB n=1 Tax=Candidatus Saccharicenans subterraneus TaxID=2508984 RepID=A0A3E2BQ26_9BACT|nr:phosphate ABC transporter ATP-binding protein [Candidatus Aminicenantes bacterium]RFT16883.1 MAG: Phosphate transport ATP-binding protein PstB [Candidatus Saccharicenans subterraneum]